MNKKILFRSFLLGMICMFPIITQASSYVSYRYQDISGDQLLITQGKTGAMNKFVCGINSMSCAATASSSLSGAYKAGAGETIGSTFASPNGRFAVVEKITKQSGVLRQYFLASSTDNWVSSTSTLLNIDQGIDQVVYSDINNSFAVLVSSADSKKRKDIIFYDLEANKVLASTSTTDRITNGIYSANGLAFAYYVPSVTNYTTDKKFVMLRLKDGVLDSSTFAWKVAREWELLTDANRLHSFSEDSGTYAFIDDSQDYPQPKYTTVWNGFTNIQNAAWPDLGTAADVMPVGNTDLLIVANSKSRPYIWSLYVYNIHDGYHLEIAQNVSILYELKKLNNGKILFPMIEGSNMKPKVYDPATRLVSNFTGLNWEAASDGITRQTMQFANGAYGNMSRAADNKKLTDKPILVWLHGGPFRQTSLGYHSYPSYATYDWMLDQAAQGGAVVLKLDYPGSYGYGNAYTYSLLGKDGQIDAVSIMENIREFKKMNKLKGQVYLAGNSYGGYLGAKLIVDYPGEIRQAITVNGVYEWRTLLKYLNTSIFNIHFNGLYDPNSPTAYDAASITAKIDSLGPKNKISVVVSSDDKTINNDQSFTFIELLKSKKKNYDLTYLPGDDHILKLKDSNEVLCQKVFKELGLKAFAGVCNM